MNNRGLKKEGIYHSDRGSQYTLNDYEELLKNLGIRHLRKQGGQYLSLLKAGITI